MKFRRGAIWWLSAAAYIAFCLWVIPKIECFFSPFTFHIPGHF